MLGGRRKKDYDAEAAAHNLEQQAAAMGLTEDDVPLTRQPVPAEDPIADDEDEAAA